MYSHSSSRPRLLITPERRPSVRSALFIWWGVSIFVTIGAWAEPSPPRQPDQGSKQVLEAKPDQSSESNIELKTTPTLKPSPDTARAPEPGFIARSGELKWTARDASTYLKRYRAWLNWETSAPQPISVLEDTSAFRRILINTIEREVIVRHARAAELERGPIPGRPQFRDWLLKLIPGALRPKPKDLEHFIRGRLKMKAGDDLSFFWLAVEDAYWVQRLQSALVRALPEEEARREWKRRGELISAWIMQVPRVPTSGEISKAAQRYKADMKTYYDDNMKLFSQPVRLLVAPYWIRGGKIEPQKKQASEIRDRFAQGEAIERLIEEFPMLTQGGVKSIRGRSIPPKTEIKEGALTPVRLTRYGWTFYHIKRVYPAYVRSLKERSVQREVAAAILRARDDLPRAQKLAQSALLELQSAKSIADLKRWGRSRRIRVSAPAPFFASKQSVVPTVGLAPQLHAAIVNAEVNAVITPIKVRQHYVVARVLERTTRGKSWTEERDYFMTSWRRERKPQVLDEWLTRVLKSEPRWINTPKLKSIELKQLEFEASIPSK